jgi:hypothetical protein
MVSNKQKNFKPKLIFVGILKATEEKRKIRIRSQPIRICTVWYETADLDPYQNTYILLYAGMSVCL